MKSDWVWEFEDGSAWLSKSKDASAVQNQALFLSARNEFLRRCKASGTTAKFLIRRRRQGETVLGIEANQSA